MGLKGKAKQNVGFLSKESMVEVARDKQGSKGSCWFTAKILKREQNTNLLVQYQTLFSQDQNLTENVHISSVRPLPPPPAADQTYEPGDVVDAFHCGGWWKGVVAEVEVLDGGSRSRRTQCEEQSEHADNIAEHSEVVVSAMSSTSLQDQTDTSSCKMNYAIAISHAHDKSSVEKSRKYPLDKDCAGEQHNVSKATASEMGSEGCASKKEPEFSMKTNMENGGERHNVCEGSATDMKSKDHASKMSVFSTKRDMEVIEVYQEGDVENSNQSSAMFVQSSGQLVKTEEMLFMKSSSFWQYVDSLDVFQFLPQKPHFTPLFDCIDATREGYTIGHMLNFANVVEKTSELKVEKSREVFDSYLEVLANLEMFGFDVKVVVERIYKLLSMKSQKEQLEYQSKGIHNKIAECNGEKAKVEEEINAINKMISELEEQRAVKLSEKATKDSEINLIQNDANSISSNIVNMKLEFESQVAAPWYRYRGDSGAEIRNILSLMLKLG